MTTAFQYKGVNYRAERIDAMRQFHVVRRLAPVLAQLAAAFGKVAPPAKAPAPVPAPVPAPEAVAEPTAAAPIDPGAIAGLEGVANALAGLSDADAEYVLHTLLSHVTREQPGAGWHKVSNGSSFMYDDLPLPTLMYLAFKSLQENLGDFFAAIPSNLKAAALKASDL